MRIFTFVLVFTAVSCAHQSVNLVERPSWVQGIRSGDESLKITHGNKVFYRRIAGSKQMSQQTSCDLAVIRVTEDIKKEFPHTPSVPFSIDILVYDKEFSDCAVTASVSGHLYSQQEQLAELSVAYESRIREIASKDSVSEDEATQLIQHRSETATRFALTGMTKEEFEKFAKDKVYVNIGGSKCTKAFKTDSFSIHGTTNICWRGENILGYCTSKDGQCWTKVP